MRIPRVPVLFFSAFLLSIRRTPHVGVVLAIFFLALNLPASKASAATAPLAILHVTVIDGTGRPAQTNQTVLIESGRIAAVGPSSAVEVPGAARTIDASGKFLLPGFWDMHVHIAGLNADPTWSNQVLLPLLLANGITGVRDMGGDLDTLLAWDREIETGTLIGPHLVFAGPFLVGRGRKSTEQYPIHSAQEARAAVDDLQERGANFIKIISMPSREAFFALADECKKMNITFVGHLPFEIGASEASDAGMRSIEHFYYSSFALSFSSKEAELRSGLTRAQRAGDSAASEQIEREAYATYDPQKAAGVIATLKKNGTWVTPTLASLDITSHPEKWKADNPLLAYVPPALAKQWRDSMNDAKMMERSAWLSRQASNDWKLTRELHRAGVPLLVGSDSLDPFVFPGDSFHHELEEFVRAGFSPMEALQAATHRAAQFLGRERDFGTVEQGRTADLVLLSADPTRDIANTRQVWAVVRNGGYYDRAALDAMLAKARESAAAFSAAKP